MNVMMIPPSSKFLTQRRDVRENKNDDDDVDNDDDDVDNDDNDDIDGDGDPYVKAPLFCQHANKDDEEEEVEKIND